MMSIVSCVPENLPVSWLTKLDKLEDSTLILDSNFVDKYQLKSNYLTFKELYTGISNIFNLSDIWPQISDLYDSKTSISDFLCNWVSTPADQLYVPSAYYYGISSVPLDNKLSIGILNHTEYKLSTGMNQEFTSLGTTLTTILSTYIPSLNKKITSLDENQKFTHYISSIIDANGHIQSFEYGKYSDAFEKILPSNTVSSDVGYFISSVSSKGGKVISCEQGLISAFSGQNEYEDAITRSDNIASYLFKKHDLKIVKLTYAQLQRLSSYNKIIKDCIYMTIDDADI